LLAALEAAHRHEAPGRRIFATVGSKVLQDPRAKRAAFDRTAPGRFVMVSSWAGHTEILSTAALVALGISEEEPDPPGGWFERMPGSRRVTGVIHEYAQYPLGRRLLEEEGEDAAVRAFQETGEQAARFGITTIQDMSNGLTIENALAALRKAEARVRIRLIRFPMDGPGGTDWPDSRSLAPSQPAGLVTVSGVKWILDGTPIESNAAMRLAYAERPGWFGRLNFTPTEVGAMLAVAGGGAGQPMLHVVGDRAVELLLDQMEASGGHAVWASRRVRIEHGDGLTPDLFARVRALGVVVVQNPIHFTFPELFARRLGKDRAKTFQPMRSLLAAGIPLAIGSDGPMNPFLQIMCALAHANNPAEAITIEQAVAAYSRGSAFAEFEETRRGHSRRVTWPISRFSRKTSFEFPRASSQRR
jgi:predicted amidohydrolase YtcJ